MSTETATQFLDELTRNPSWRVDLQSTGTPNDKSVLDFALTKDFVFTDKDLKSALADYPDNPTIDQLRERLRVAKSSRSAQSGR